MSEVAQELWLVRHGETEWSRDHRHTSTTDLPLTAVGVRRSPAGSPAGSTAADFDLVLTSPAAAGPATPPSWPGSPTPEVDADLAEWDYGDYEGITTVEIRETVPGWTGLDPPDARRRDRRRGRRRLDRVVDAGAGRGRPHPGLRARRTRCGRSPRAGSACRSPTAGCSAWTPPRCRCSATSATAASSSAGTPEPPRWAALDGAGPDAATVDPCRCGPQCPRCPTPSESIDGPSSCADHGAVPPLWRPTGAVVRRLRRPPARPRTGSRPTCPGR